MPREARELYTWGRRPDQCEVWLAVRSGARAMELPGRTATKGRCRHRRRVAGEGACRCYGGGRTCQIGSWSRGLATAPGRRSTHLRKCNRLLHKSSTWDRGAPTAVRVRLDRRGKSVLVGLWLLKRSTGTREGRAGGRRVPPLHHKAIHRNPCHETRRGRQSPNLTMVPCTKQHPYR